MTRGSASPHKFGNILINTFSKIRWFNSAEFCNRKTHPQSFTYRKYRRGKNRCASCGAKIGKVNCKRDTYRNRITDNIYQENTLLKMLDQNGRLAERSDAPKETK